MKTQVFVPEHHSKHQPSEDLSDGTPPFPHPEIPQRIDAIVMALKALPDLEFLTESGLAKDEVRQLHDADYVDFLMAITAQLGSNAQYIPSIFHDDMSDAPLRFQGGMYCNEIGTPIGLGSIPAALNSAAAALSAARYIQQTHKDTIVLCRPPGHHAGRRRYGGYCFFNNAYLASKWLAQEGRCCPVLDIDYHLGDGSIEFAGPKTPYFSLHADPWKNYPYLDARAKADRPHTHLAILERDTGIAQYLEHLSLALEALTDYTPDFTVLSLGLDTLISDHIQDAPIKIAQEDFYDIGARIATAIKTPVLIVLEGGYDVSHLGTAMAQFWEGFRHSRLALQ